MNAYPPGSHRQTLHNITGWLTDLADLTAGSVPVPDAKERAATLASILIEEYPAGAFTRQSLIAVARQCKYFPSYAELCTALSAWWQENRTAPTAIAGPDADLDENARLWVAYYRKREAEGFCALANAKPSSRQHVLSLVKARSLAAWQHLTGDRPESRRTPTDEEKHAVRETVAALERDLAAQPTPASHPLTAQIAAATASARPEPRHLTPEQLAEARKAARIAAPQRTP